MSTNKITENLKWESLRNSFRIGLVKVDGKNIEINELATAIEDGTLDSMVQTCADTLHGGDSYEVLLALSKNLSSKKTNMAKTPRNINTNTDTIMLSLLREYVSSKMAALKGSSRSGNSKPYWQYTKEEIEAADTFQLVKSIYDCMASVKSKYPDITDKIADFEERKALVSAKKSAMLKEQKNATPAVGDVLLTKLTSGKKATLSAEEAATLANILAKLQK